MTFRTIAARHPARRDDIGDLLTRRPLPGPGLAQVDPFLFLNHHGPQTYLPGMPACRSAPTRIAVSRR